LDSSDLSDYFTVALPLPHRFSLLFVPSFSKALDNAKFPTIFPLFPYCSDAMLSLRNNFFHLY